MLFGSLVCLSGSRVKCWWFFITLFDLPLYNDRFIDLFALMVLQRGNEYVANSTITSIAAVGLFSAAGCMYALKKWGKQLQLSSRRNL